MKHKKDSSNIKSVNKPSKSPVPEETRIVKEKTNSNDCHQDIVKRLMTHSQYFPANPNSKPVAVTYSTPPVPTYNHTPYSMTPQYQSYNQVPQVFTTNNYYHKDSYYQQPQPTYDHFANINIHPSCLSPSLSSPSTHNFDQISNGSPRQDYVFNGDFTLNFNTDFDASFPLIDAKTSQLFDNQAPLEIKSFEMVSSGNIGQLTPVKIESPTNDEIKNSFIDGKNNNALVNLADDDVLSNASCSSRPSPSATVEWRFAEQ